MGCAASKRCAELREESAVLRSKVHALEEEVRRERRERAAKEGAWRRERRRQEGEMAALRKKLGAEERRRRELEDESAAAAAGGGGGGDGLSKEELRVLSACRLVEQMKTEQERREQAVEKWKQLYLAIKAELDALILRTKEGERLWVAAEDDAAERLRGEVEVKEAAMGELRERLAAAEAEGTKKEREIDILRQSLRILTSSSKKRSRLRRIPPVRSLRP
ncbi:unnamed protein product [Spirodela intermedia]|uniref:Uncharacterized protein n=1 Tax=Spirodela intermedia TaxID=51605 RepID=A0A7I8KZP8_SPIIN|nr:unnamed protein product [Spirodela intermedia]